MSPPHIEWTWPGASDDTGYEASSSTKKDDKDGRRHPWWYYVSFSPQEILDWMEANVAAGNLRHVPCTAKTILQFARENIDHAHIPRLEVFNMMMHAILELETEPPANARKRKPCVTTGVMP